MSTKNFIMKKKIAGKIYDVFAKTSAEMVAYENSTVAKKLAEALAAIAVLNGDTDASVAKRIENAVKDKADKADVISSIVASATNGAISVTKGETTTDIKVKGAVVAPTYDAETRKITLPTIKDDGTVENLEINLGKDMVVKSGSYNKTSKKIVLVLTDDSTVEIPAGDLVDIYTGGETASATVSVSDDNVVTAQVKVSSKEGNQVQVIEEEGKQGIYVPTPAQVDISGKVDKEHKTGSSTEYKVLSDNNYTDEEKQKLQGLENYDDSSLTTKVNAKARVLVSATEPADLTENDLWLQEVTE